MSETAQHAKVLCYYNPEVAESLRQVGLEVFPASGEASDRPVYDWAPALYVYAPQLVVAPIPDGGRRTYEADRELDEVFWKARKEAGARPLPHQAFVPDWTCLPPRLGESIKSGCILAVAFAAKVAVEDRRALLPWGAWREAERLRGMMTDTIGWPTGHEVNLRRWRETWKVPVDLLSLAPSVEYTADLLKDLLPVLPPPTTWTVPVDGQTVSAESLRRERIARRQSDLGGVRSPGFHFKVEEPPMAAFPVKGGPAWASSLLPPDGLKVRVVIKAYHYDSAQKDAVQQAVAKMYQVDPSVARIVPLFVNRLGDLLGVAVRIGKGSILILPEFPDEAAVVKRLVTDLWGPVQAWLAEQSRANTAGFPKPDAVPAQRVLPSLTAPSGPQIKAGSKMDTPKGSLDPPGLALEVAGTPPKMVTSALGHHGTGNAAALRKVAEALRAWGESHGSPEAIDAWRTFIDLAKRHFNIMMDARNRWPCRHGVPNALDMLGDIIAQQGHTDFRENYPGPYMVLPDELDRWANKLEEAALASEQEGADVPESTVGAAGGGKTPNDKEKPLPQQGPEKRSWLQPELDRAIGDYKALRGAEYSRILSVLNDPKATSSQRRAARKSATKLFGRNVVAKALDVKAAKMVSNSPAWITLAEAFDFNLRRRQQTGFRQDSKVGLDLAIDKKSQAPKAGADNSAADAALEEGEREKTLREIRRLAESANNSRTSKDKQARRKEAQDLLAKYEAGEQTNEQVRQTVEVLLSPDS